MRGKRSIISLIIVCLIGCMLCGCDKKQDTEKEIGKNAPKIVVGSDNYPPFNYMDENGNPIPGLEPDESVLPGEGGRLAATVAELEAERDAVRGLGLL